MIIFLFTIIYSFSIKRKSPNLGDAKKYFGNTQHAQLNVPFLFYASFFAKYIISQTCTFIKYKLKTKKEPINWIVLFG